MTIAAVIIGRNEGERFRRCLASLPASITRVIYVDSGSTDGSIEAAQTAGATVIRLDDSQIFTAARARNAGLEALRQDPRPDFVQFLDGDCALQPGWIDAGRIFLERHPDVAVVCGRRRERYPDATLYNSLCDREWSTPIGLSKACGGDALMRRSALDQVGGYNSLLIAGEEPEMCVRLRAAGWTIWRIDAEMTLHDIAMTRFSQFWKRARRAGHAFAEGAALHGAPPERHAVPQRNRALLWGAALPIAIAVLTLAIGWHALALLLVYPVQAARLAWRDRNIAGGWRRAFGHATLLTVAKFAEAAGACQYYGQRFLRRSATPILYK